MKHWCLLFALVAFATGSVLVVQRPAQAMPEYVGLTGDPCASCHMSPSGGGLRTPEGQAWVASGRPETVPDLPAALELLGVHFEAQKQGRAGDVAVRPSEPTRVESGEGGAQHDLLSRHDGN